jgi:hypothetical protein
VISQETYKIKQFELNRGNKCFFSVAILAYWLGIIQWSQTELEEPPEKRANSTEKVSAASCSLQPVKRKSFSRGGGGGGGVERGFIDITNNPPHSVTCF